MCSANVIFTIEHLQLDDADTNSVMQSMTYCMNWCSHTKSQAEKNCSVCGRRFVFFFLSFSQIDIVFCRLIPEDYYDFKW